MSSVLCGFVPYIINIDSERALLKHLEYHRHLRSIHDPVLTVFLILRNNDSQKCGNTFVGCPQKERIYMVGIGGALRLLIPTSLALPCLDIKEYK